MPHVIELDHLSVKLGRRVVLDDITCRLGAEGGGRAIGLLGPNGAGKSTLIRTLLGFHRPWKGSARILGYDCHRFPRDVRGRIGYMPETEAIIAEMSAVTFLRLMGQISGLPAEAALEKAHEVLYHVGLGEARYRPLGTYSLGMRQMAKFAQAILHGPELLILDEPTNGLDPAARRRMLELIREMKDEHGMCVLLCSHLLHDVEAVCDEVVILHNGRVVHEADLEAERRANLRFVELEVRGEDSGLGEALRQVGAQSVREGEGRWRIVMPAGVELDALWAILDRLKLGVHKLTHRRDSLEEIFLKAVGHLRETPGEAVQRQQEVAHGRV
jgi:ABC-2 type transport system ATP-binding protein